MNGNGSIPKTSNDAIQRLLDKFGNNFTDKPATSIKKELGKDDFVKLMSVQLQYQDPMSPLNNEQMAAQLAQFSSLEQMTNVNKNLNAMSAAARGRDNIMATALIGKEIIANSSLVSLDGKNPADLDFHLESKIRGGQISILNKNGAVVNKITLKNMNEGAQKLKWDGLNDDGVKVPSGEYAFHITAYDHNMKQVKSSAQIKGIVSGVVFENSQAVLILDNKKISMDSVSKISSVEEKKNISTELNKSNDTALSVVEKKSLSVVEKKEEDPEDAISPGYMGSNLWRPDLQ